MMGKTDFLKKVHEIVDAVNPSAVSNKQDLSNENIHTSLKFNRDLSKGIVRYKQPSSSFLGRFKTFFIRKVENISLNLFEKSLMKQTRFNDAVYKKLLDIEKEIQELKNNNNDK